MHFIEKEDYSTPEARAARYPWGTPPPKIDESLIKETVEADVAIIGGGISGLATGARCVQLGQSVVVVDKYKGLVAHGAHVASVGSRIQRENGVFIDKKQFARDWMRISGSRCNEDLLWLFVNKSEEAFEWLLETGGEAVEGKLFGGYYKGPDFTEYPGTHVVYQKPGYHVYKHDRTAFLYCEIMEKVILDAKQRIDRNTAAKYLEKDENGRVVSFIARDNDGVYRRYVGRKAVVLATGDIAGNREMLKYFAPLGLVPHHNGYFPEGVNTGDGHQMAYWAGAEYEQHDWALSLHLIAYSMYAFFFLHVNRQGKRYMNEDTWVQAKAIRTAQQPNGQWAWSVFDDRWADQVRYLSPFNGGQFCEPLGAIYGEAWKEPEEGNEIVEAIETYVKNGLCCKADTLEELAEQMGVPKDAFLATVERYNQMYKQQNDEDYGKRAALLTPIDKPPFYALKFGPSLLDVFGGVITDVKLRVLDKDYNPIPGLLAVGMIAGGLYGVDYPLLFNGNSHGRCLTWARQAAETIVNGES